MGRAIAAMASDPDRARWNQKSVSTAQLASDHGFADLDGSTPDVWRYMDDPESGVDADPADYR